MNDEICVCQVLAVSWYDHVERVNCLKGNLLLVLVPDYLSQPAPVEEQVVDDRNNLFLEVRLLAHLVIKPTLGRDGDRSQLLAHRDEAGKDVVANRAVDEAGF